MAAVLDNNTKASVHYAAEDVELSDGAASGSDVVDASVPSKYRGTEEDQMQMKIMGRTQETRRMFTAVTMLGFGSTMMTTWVCDSTYDCMACPGDTG